jgi:alpha-glucosidase (family GH31 glycosyl hydrolase)
MMTPSVQQAPKYQYHETAIYVASIFIHSREVMSLLQTIFGTRKPDEPIIRAAVAAISRKTLGARYALLSYLYTQFYLAHRAGLVH